MILNSKNNQFVFRFPHGFIHPEIEKKYSFYLKRLPNTFENVLDYLNHTIQSVSMPSVSSDEVEQMVGRRTFVEGKQVTKNPQYWRQSLDLGRVINKEFTVNLMAADAYLNYWVLFEVYLQYLTIPNMEDFMPDMSLQYLDREGYRMLTIDFKQPIMKGISEVEMNYAATGMEFRTFSVTFRYNTFDIDVPLTT